MGTSPESSFFPAQATTVPSEAAHHSDDSFTHGANRAGLEDNAHICTYVLPFLSILHPPLRTAYPPSLLNFQTRMPHVRRVETRSPVSTTAMWFVEGTCHGVIPSGLRALTFRYADAVEGTRIASYESSLQPLLPLG